MRDCDDIPHDLTFAYTLKAAFENILGHKTFMKLKECHDLKVWKTQSERLLRASMIAFDTAVEVADDIFQKEVEDEINQGIKSVKSVKSINDLFSSLAGIYARLSFLQLGLRLSRRVDGSLKKECWKLNNYRTVQYVQTKVQKRNLDFSVGHRRKSRERIGSIEVE